MNKSGTGIELKLKVKQWIETDDNGELWLAAEVDEGDGLIVMEKIEGFSL